jgi:hypothetical protein
MAATSSGLTPHTKRGLAILLDTFRGLGYSATYTSGYRSVAKQRQLYAAYRSGRSALPAAPPGSSEHNYGLAVDVVTNAPDSVKLFAADVAGLVWFGPGDYVHYGTYPPAAWRDIVRRAGMGADVGFYLS